MNLLGDIKTGDEIEYIQNTDRKNPKTSKGIVTQVTGKLISLQGKNYPDTILVNDLISGQAKILKLTIKGGDTMARYDWDTLWPQVQELQAKGKSVTDIAIELGIDRKILTSKIYREKNKQTPTPEPDELGGTDPERENVESATEIISELEYLKQTGKEEEYGCPFDEPAYNPNPPEDNGFTAADEEPIPYQLVETILEHHHVADEIAELLDQKRADYGTENIKKFGSYGVLVRVSDKVERLINLSRKEGQVNFESVEDSWKDIAGYAILALIELREGR